MCQYSFDDMTRSAVRIIKTQSNGSKTSSPSMASRPC